MRDSVGQICAGERRAAHVRGQKAPQRKFRPPNHSGTVERHVRLERISFRRVIVVDDALSLAAALERQEHVSPCGGPRNASGGRDGGQAIDRARLGVAENDTAHDPPRRLEVGSEAGIKRFVHTRILNCELRRDGCEMEALGRDVP